MHRLFLFDIDGTLMDSGGAGTRSLGLAFRDVFAIENGFSGISMAGKTDIQIIKEGCSSHGIPVENGIIPSLLSRYVYHLRIEIRKSEKRVKPGIIEALKRLRTRKNCHIGLLTGNIEEGAKIKLGALGLDAYFAAGAFGSDDEDRGRLLPVAVRKFERLLDESIPYGNCIVIGDTPRDVSCSKPYGALSIAVATGPYSYQSLRRTGADLVLPDLSNTEEFLSFCFAAPTE